MRKSDRRLDPSKLCVHADGRPCTVPTAWPRRAILREGAGDRKANRLPVWYKSDVENMTFCN